MATEKCLCSMSPPSTLAFLYGGEHKFSLNASVLTILIKLNSVKVKRERECEEKLSCYCALRLNARREEV